MVDKISDERFKEEMLRLMRFTVLKVGENVKEIGLLKMDVERNTRELKKLRKDIRTGFGFDNDLWFMSPFAPLRHRLRVDPIAARQHHQALLTMLYRSTHRLCRRGATV